MDSINNSHSNLTTIEAYRNSLYRFVIYDGIRILQMIIGIIGNGMTLHIIRNLKVLKNEHILMACVATSLILVNCLVPAAIFLSIIGTFKNRLGYWRSVSLWTDYISLSVGCFAFVSYLVLSVDR